MAQDRVAIIAAGQTAFRRQSGVSIRELCFDAFTDALRDAQIESGQIDASIVCSAGEYDKQRSPAGVINEHLGLDGRPTFNCEALCASGSAGLRIAYSMIQSGLHDVIAVVGFQKMSELNSGEVAERMGRGADVMWEAPFGMAMPAAFAMFASAHQAAYGTTEEQLAKVRVKNSVYSALNDRAAFRKQVSVDDVMQSAMITSPLKMFDCCGNADGASALILAAGHVARKLSDKPIWIRGLGASSMSATLANRASFTYLQSVRNAAASAYEMAGLSPAEIDVAEVHDCFTISELLAYEDLGFAAPGQGAQLLEDGETSLGGAIPVNLDGGLLCKGHPIGATGGSQIRTIVRQLRGECGEVQVSGAKIGLTHNLGGPGNYAFVTIFGGE